MLKKIIFFIVIILLVGVGIFSFNSYTSYKENKKEEQKYGQQLKKDVHSYLINDKNYKDSDIKQMKITENSKQRGLRSVEIDVVFNDDLIVLIHMFTIQVHVKLFRWLGMVRKT